MNGKERPTRLPEFDIPTPAKVLPADPEGMNSDRASWADSAIKEFMAQTGTDREDAVCDLIADLAHWCDRNGQDFATEFERGLAHYGEETESECGPIDSRAEVGNVDREDDPRFPRTADDDPRGDSSL